MTRYPDGGMRYGDAPRPRSPIRHPAALFEIRPSENFCGKKGVCQKINNYSVYKHTSPDGKVYIGVTKQDPKDRWCGGFGYADNLYFLTDIMTFGWVNFQHEVLETGLNEQEALEKEAELIAMYRSTDPKFGYNRSPGRVITRIPHLKRLSKEDNNPIKKSKLGGSKTYNTARPIRCVETGDVFPSINSVARSLDVDPTSLKKQMRQGHRCRGYHWEFVTNEQEEHSA